MNVRKELMLFSIVSIVFLAGCTQGGAESPTGTGVIIKSFSPDLTSVEGGSQVVFTAVVKNVGARTAGASITGIPVSGVGATLFGLSNEWGAIGTKLITSSLAAADPASGLPGEEGSIDWTVTSPPGKGSDVTYDAAVRVNYTYSTVADTLLRFVNSNYARTNPNAPKGIISSQSTAGPLSITTFARTPTVSTDSRVGKLQVEIQNVGGGRVGNETVSGLDIIREIKIVGTGTAGKCADASADANKVVTLNNIRLAAGKSKVISCDVDVGVITNFQDIALNVTANYQYFVDSATQVTVLRALQ